MLQSFETGRARRALAAGCVALLLLLSLLPAASAAEPIRVVLDGRELAFDVPPRIVEGRTLAHAGHLRGAGRLHRLG